MREGRIPVDENYQTKQPHVYAVGDVIGFPSLGSVSMEQGRIAAARAFWHADEFEPRELPLRDLHHSRNLVYRKTEEQLTEEGVPYEVGMAFFREIARGQIRGDTTGRLNSFSIRPPRNCWACTLLVKELRKLLHIGQAVFRAERNRGIFRGYRFQLSDAGGGVIRRPHSMVSTNWSGRSHVRVRSRLTESSTT